MESAFVSSHSKNGKSFIKATFTASEIPERQSRSESEFKKVESLKTATGGENVPRKFFFPKKFTPFFTPTPESF